MKGLIVAAGESSRLYPRTLDKPKCLLEIDGEPIIERSLRLLAENGIDDVCVVVGYRDEMIREQLGDRVDYVANPFFEITNNMASMWMGMEEFDGDDFVYMHSDLVFEPSIMKDFLQGVEGAAAGLAVDFASNHAEAMKVRTREGDFVESSKEIPAADTAGEWIGLAYFDAAMAARLGRTIERQLLDGEHNWQNYDTSAFTELAGEGAKFTLPETDGRPWKEIDTEEDYDEARELFS